MLKPPSTCHVVSTQEIVTAVNGMNDRLSHIVPPSPAAWCTLKGISFTFVFQKIEVTDLFPS